MDWNVLDDKDFEAAKTAVKEVDRTPTHRLSMRSDEHGWVEVIRAEEYPEGWGSPIAEEGNAIAARVAQLVLLALEWGKLVSIENPENSYGWYE